MYFICVFLRGFDEIIDAREKVISDKGELLRGVNFCLSDRDSDLGR